MGKIKKCAFEFIGVSTEFELLYYSVVDNLDFFYFIREKHWYGNGFVNLLRNLLCHLHWYEDNLTDLYHEAPKFDVSDKIHGNGFRSFVLIFERCFSECHKFSKHLQWSRSSFFFRAGHFLDKADCLVKMLIGLKPALKFLLKMLHSNLDYNLLMPEKTFTAEELIEECNGINQLVFYGRLQGFYYCTSMQRILQGVGVIMATFSDLYQTTGSPISRAFLTVVNSLKYVLNPGLRAKEIVDVAQNSSVEFLKSFWRLGESQFMLSLPGWICPKLEVRKEVFIPAQPITLKSNDLASTVVIPIPSSHIPTRPVRCLLLSAICRKGQVFNKNSVKCKDLSSSLLFHCHGGGFISQSPESHEIYLRSWAKDLNIPIFSIDYSLSPEAPYPRALEEVVLAYAWVLQNSHKLGWTGERICFAGDSAGGNILMGVLLKTIALGIRKPDAVFCAYSPLILDMAPSPSRLLCWIDPLLPLGFMLSCLDAYAGSMETDGKEYDEEQFLSEQPKRKISSFSKIFDSSLNFINQCEWTEIEANEPSLTDDSIVFNGPSKKATEYDYVNDFIDEHSKNIYLNTNEEIKSIEEYTLFNFPLDIFFCVKSKYESIAETSFNMLSNSFISSSLYQKIIAPFMPYEESFNQSKNFSGPLGKQFINVKMKNLKLVSKHPFMSPLLASDDYLKQMPPIYFVSLTFDPCLDDTITFAKRLKALKQAVEVDVLDGLPHGFLNFLPFSQEAHNGSDLCVRRLKEALQLS